MEKYDKFFFFFKFLYAHFFSLCNAKIFQLNHWVRGFWNAWSLSGLPRGLNLWIKRTPKNTSKSFRECNSNDDLFWQLCYKLSRIIHLHDLLVTNIFFSQIKYFLAKTWTCWLWQLQILLEEAEAMIKDIKIKFKIRKHTQIPRPGSFMPMDTKSVKMFIKIAILGSLDFRMNNI